MDLEDDSARVKADLTEVFNNACKGRKRHDKILKACVLEAHRTHPQEPLLGFVTFLSRKLQKDESVIIGHQVANALDRHELRVFEKLQGLMQHLPPNFRLESMPVVTRSGNPVFLVVSRHAFRASEITRDIWRSLHPDASPELRLKNDLVVNCMHVAENLKAMGAQYDGNDLIDALHLIAQDGGFFLRALFLFHVNIEPKPFSEHLERKGFHVSFVLDEKPSTEPDPEHDFLKRLQGFLIAKSPESMATTMEHMYFLVELCNQIPVPKGDLTWTGQLH